MMEAERMGVGLRTLLRVCTAVCVCTRVCAPGHRPAPRAPPVFLSWKQVVVVIFCLAGFERLRIGARLWF